MYQHIFFDLDHTLWDYEKNANETLSELYDEHFQEVTFSKKQFFEAFHTINEELWKLFNFNQITSQELRDTRFIKIFSLLNFKEWDRFLAERLTEQYLERSPQKPHLMPYAIEVLDYLHQKYHLHVVTNGFAEIQRIKMSSGKITDYFQSIVTSAESGYKKPDRRMFDFLIGKLQSRCSECLMIGDNLEADIAGAINAQVDVVFYNPHHSIHQATPTFEIDCLSRLREIL